MADSGTAAYTQNNAYLASIMRCPADHVRPQRLRGWYPSKVVGVDRRLGESLRSFLRQIVADAATDGPMRVFAGEFVAIGRGFRMRCTIGIALEGDGGHGDDRAFSEPLFQVAIFRLAFGQAEPPAIIMDHDGDMIGVVEGRRAAIERGVIEIPLRRS